MKKLRYVSAGVAAMALVAAFAVPMSASAATTPSLGAAATYGVLSDTYSNPIGPTTINGDVGYTTAGGVTPLPLPRPSGTYANYGSGGNYSSAGTAQAAALVNLNSQPCTFTFVAPNVVLDTTLEHVTTYAPGVYCSTGTMAVGTAGGITLSGNGTYIFRSGGALNTVASATVNLTGGASACDVFWTPNGATTLNANSTFVGTVIPVSQDITVYSTVNWTGRALTYGHTVTTPNSDVVITVPSACAAPPGSGSSTGNITVVKNVINDNGGTKVIADFPLFINGLPVTSGVSNQFAAPGPVFTVTETSNAQYTRTFSGDCDANGQMNLNKGQIKFCIVTNNDIGAPAVPPVPPLIDVVKVPSPLALPGGPGQVTYTYTARNIGPVPMTNVTLVGDTCSPIVRISGDTNSNNILDLTETWVHTCTTTLTATHTNTVVATGWANGLSATDIASATVIVGAPVVPPLIHVTKVPQPLTLSTGGGAVTYTNTVTNPGTVALSNVQLSDDKCSPVSFVSGDSNGDLKLDSSESWTYTCTSNLKQTTINTVIATGEANGLIARDFAIATVVVAFAPTLPQTGFPPATGLIAWIGIVSALVAGAVIVFAARKKKTT